MARAIETLDPGSTQLHGRWRGVARMSAFAFLAAVLSWALVSALRAGVHLASDRLLESDGAHGRWRDALVLAAVLVAGGLARGLLNRWAGWSAVASDGIDVALDNLHCTGRDGHDDPSPRYARPTFTLALRKAAATLLTLGTGGSGGLEAPSVLVGESLGAGFARTGAAKTEDELVTYQLAGIAAAIGTLLSAPFTAALFAMEIAYGGAIQYRKLAYCLFASIVAYALNGLTGASRPVFTAPPHAPTYTLEEYALTALVAVAISAPVALSFALAMKHTRELVDRASPVLRGAAGGLGAALVAVVLLTSLGLEPRHVLGMGDDTVRDLLSSDPPEALTHAWVLFLIVGGKLLTTGFTVQSGGSAGLLIPSMVLGGVSGAATARTIASLGVTAADPALSVVVGVACSLVAVVGVPLSAIALVLETFGAPYGPPAVLACGLTYVLTLRLSVYRQPARKAVEGQV